MYSESLDQYYIGFSENPENRIKQHNSLLNQGWTKRGQPWILVKKLEFQTKAEALKTEKFIKKQKSKIFIKKIIEKGWE